MRVKDIWDSINKWEFIRIMKDNEFIDFDGLYTITKDDVSKNSYNAIENCEVVDIRIGFDERTIGEPIKYIIIEVEDYKPKIMSDGTDGKYEVHIDLDKETIQNITNINQIKNTTNVNHPKHYNHGEFETIEKIQAMLTSDEYKGFLKGNYIKYIDRADYKGHKDEDLEKANWYMRELIKIEE